MFYGSDGRPDANGRFQLINGKLVLRDGVHVGFDMMFMDSKSAKTEKPATIDEALRQRFAEMAKGQNTTVGEMLASMPQAKIEETAAEVARAFISAQAGEGVASQFGDSAWLGDAESNYAVARASQAHHTRHAHLPENRRPAFTSDAAAAAVAVALALRIRDGAVQSALAADPENNLDFQRGIDAARRAALKYVVANAWRS